jgi:hypothetical protein
MKLSNTTSLPLSLPLSFLMLGCGNSAQPGPFSHDVQLTAPTAGFQLEVPDFPVIAGSEVQDCYYFAAPINQPMYVHRLEVALNPGSHHMNLFKYVGSDDPTHKPGDIQRGCWDAVAFENYDLVFNSQNAGDTDWTLPAGVSHYFQPGDMFMLQTHYVNASSQKTTLGVGKVLMNFYEAGPADTTYRLGSVFANNRAISLPPMAPSSFTTTCQIPAAVTLVAASGHFHSRGTEFDIGIVSDVLGDNYNQIYQSTSWDSPPWKTYDPGFAIQAGGAVQYTCKYVNTTDMTITFGPHVEYQEHCNLFGYFYPALPTGRGSVYCF